VLIRGLMSCSGIMKRDDLHNGLPLYRALWSDHFCHTGLSYSLGRISADWFTPARAVNRG
jgi:hypothetical protein